ncbi:MAG: hypothetical protein E5X43_10175 [Mesorhizobium sp.]|uniref:hypothetical protein n=1 Tax=Mesorhizobium sp. TaxID=1871066 RepID=UPI000FE78685|nr:hypothetical protein [Mesorhizobium sp.]RWK57925.1 MAG: hypothetical protein EOR48_02020 [Mesorhizobium sp.]TIP48408.1 MAG: hypothetical protein E5X62_01630 [Mesorhizobium sp.]TIR41542.1 MAG: hypothetical protein E5X64_07905 [Mesorhizobium sp.]TJX00469.1 MAG: hypothetical protein E5X43_10175 [Mesorhizobium sp.]
MLFDAKGHLPGMPKSSPNGSVAQGVRQGWLDRPGRPIQPVASMVRRGAVSELDVLALEEIARHPYHQEFLALFGLRWLLVQSLAD